MSDDYTRDDVNNTIDLDAYEIPSIAAESSAADIEMERSRKDPPAGDHEFFVAGFIGKPSRKSRTVWYDGKQWTYEATSIGVRMALASDPSASVVDFFEIPPADAGDQTLYKFGSTKQDMKNPGFNFAKFAHFVGRLGFTVVKGQPFPPEALRLSAWKSRRIIATVELQTQTDPTTGEPKCNPANGKPYPPRTQVKLFSYRPTGGAVSQVGSRPTPPTPPTAAPSRPTPPPTPPATSKLSGVL